MDYEEEDDIDYDDLRAVEITTLKAIFPELAIDSENKYAFTLEVPVNPAKVVTVAFPATGIIENATTDTQVAPGTSSASDASASAANAHLHQENRVIDTHSLAYLPSLHLCVTLPPAYPAEEPPTVAVTAFPPWLPSSVLGRLASDCERLWEEIGRDQVVFSYVDHIQQAADDKVFGLVNQNGFLAVDTEHKVAILNYDVAAKQAAFAKETFRCDPKKGAACHRMQDCGHVFCRQCLQDFYSSAITEGDLASIRCLEPNCSKERVAVAQQMGKKNSKPKLVSVSPGELLQIPLDESLVRRYIDLKYKTALQSDKNTVYCPRAWCNGAARSKKHKKPHGLSLHESDGEDEEEAEAAAAVEAPAGDNGKSKKAYSATEERLSICEDCAFAFCSRCLLSWHGDFVYCSPPRNTGELAEEDKASLEYLAHHTTPCPTCAAPAQKTMGCNHMICFRCNTHFCYLCAAWLDSSNPYRHFGEAPDGRRTGCFNRLWELEHGDEGGGNGQVIAFDGRAAVRVADLNESDNDNWDLPDDDLSDWDSDEDVVQGDANVNGAAAADGDQGGRGGQVHDRGGPRQRGGRDAAPHHVDVAREGPLVLRIAMDPAPGPAPLAPGNHDNDNHHGINNNDNAMAAWVRNFVELALVDNEDAED
ncbi:hypothetical protein HMPREF1624_06748 [Sporothrix schenckii ATCC 58251]|uniref:RBR-type E3 ubiquitin transferase n=1 Tax=Sporothrix schenckii (strain ATCC 58251 / de Perez 2211183) TaxID=1391915 RepID=U7PLM2_SPOS1|nr:hypothetical protein HMPREF1624_06748 [Sporothrix schenckii ATCC 58251]